MTKCEKQLKQKDNAIFKTFCKHLFDDNFCPENWPKLAKIGQNWLKLKKSYLSAFEIQTLVFYVNGWDLN